MAHLTSADHLSIYNRGEPDLMVTRGHIYREPRPWVMSLG